MTEQETALTKAHAAWDTVPDWIEALALACDKTSQGVVSKKLGRSRSMVSQVLRDVYCGPTAEFEEMVRGVYMSKTAACPVLGEIGVDVCQVWRRKARNFRNANTHTVTMYRACNRCPLNAVDQDEEEAA